MPATELPSRLGDHVTVLSEDQCWARLAAAEYGRLVFVDLDGHPVALPVSHAVDARSVVFRTVPGSKLASAATEQLVSFEVDQFDARGPSGWSVLVKGRATLVSDEQRLADRYGVNPSTWAPRASSTLVWMRVEPFEATGIEVAALD